MDYTLQPPSGPPSWMYSQQDTSLKTNTLEPLQEPVPFEDFQFSFGLDPRFAVPVPLDDTSSGPTMNRLYMDYEESTKDNDIPTASNPLLDENDQKAFSQFLDAFFVDKDGQMANAEQVANQFSTMYDVPPPYLNDGPSETIPYHVATSMFLPKPSTPQRPATLIRNDDDDEYRRTSILQSLDQQKQLHLNRVQHTNYQPESNSQNAVFLQRSNQVSAPFITKPSISQRYHHQHTPYQLPERHSPVSPKYQQDQPAFSKSLSTPTRRTNKSHKELLTEEEKRNNHIASEQKRRSTIRNGFKDLTDIVPTLKNLNNSKSTVLFKAVDYIKYLEKRNKSLRDKMDSLEVRIKVEGRVSDIMLHSSQLQQTLSHSTPTDNRRSTLIKQEHDNSMATTLLAHKTQQNQLHALQEQLQYHQRMLTRDDKLSISSSTTSSSHSSPQSADLYQQRWTFEGAKRMDVDKELSV